MTLNFKCSIGSYGTQCGPLGSFERAWPTKAQALNNMLMIGIALTGVTVRWAARVLRWLACR